MWLLATSSAGERGSPAVGGSACRLLGPGAALAHFPFRRDTLPARGEQPAVGGSACRRRTVDVLCRGPYMYMLSFPADRSGYRPIPRYMSTSAESLVSGMFMGLAAWISTWGIVQRCVRSLPLVAGSIE